MKKYISTKARYIVATLIGAMLLASCSRDPKVSALQTGMSLMENILTSRVLIDTVRNVDSQMRPSTAVDAALRGVVTANFPMPPDGIAIVNDADKPSQPWSVVIIGDDVAKQVRIEGYAEDLQKPADVRKLDFPPSKQGPQRAA